MTIRKRKQRPTLQQLAAANVGQIAGAKVVAFIVQWAIAQEAVGHPLTLDEYGDWWNASRSTVFREQARFREAFPGETHLSVSLTCLARKKDRRGSSEALRRARGRL